MKKESNAVMSGEDARDQRIKIGIEMEQFAAYVCDKLCRYPGMIGDQDVLDVICGACRMNTHVCKLVHRFEKYEKEVAEHAEEDNNAGGSSDRVSEKGRNHVQTDYAE